jgi:methyl-accepting chemotaxis protein
MSKPPKDPSMSNIMTRGYLTRLVLLVLCIFIISSAVSAVFVYLNINRPLNTHYSAILLIIAEIKETLIIRTLKINVLFSIMIFIGIVVAGIIYTHRIAGPLFRIKLYAKAVSEGRLDTRVNFRKNDAIHSFAESVNHMTQSFNGRVTMLASEVRMLKAAVAEHQALMEEDKDTAVARQKISGLDNEIKKLLSAIKL